jgi:hypothetical protein
VDAAFMSLQHNVHPAYVDHEDRSAAGRLPNEVEPGFHCARTQWDRGFIAFQLARRTRTVVLMVPAWPEFGFRVRAPRPGLLAKTAWRSSSMNAASAP